MFCLQVKEIPPLLVTLCGKSPYSIFLCIEHLLCARAVFSCGILALNRGQNVACSLVAHSPIRRMAIKE